jgi:hypothetical protein
VVPMIDKNDNNVKVSVVGYRLGDLLKDLLDALWDIWSN